MDGATTRRRCPSCYFASDTKTICPNVTCRGTEMELAPDAILDDEIYTPEAFQVQCVAERRLFARNFPERFVRPIAGFRGAPEKPVERQASTMYSFHEPEEAALDVDIDRAAALREWA